jgi:hypothetical protein
VVPFLERIFNINVSLEGAEHAEARARSRRLAEARAPGLIEEYEDDRRLAAARAGGGTVRAAGGGAEAARP